MVEFFPSLLMAMGVGAVSIAYNMMVQRKTNKEINQLRTQLQELQKAKDSATDSHTTPSINAEMLRLHYQIFCRCEEYGELQNLKYLRDQFVSARNRDRLMQAVENAYREELTTLCAICPELSAEDCFLCMMSMMKFSTHDIAACLCVTDEAIRKRRSRVRLKLAPAEEVLSVLRLDN